MPLFFRTPRNLKRIIIPLWVPFSILLENLHFGGQIWTCKFCKRLSDAVGVYWINAGKGLVKQKRISNPAWKAIFWGNGIPLRWHGMCTYTGGRRCERVTCILTCTYHLIKYQVQYGPGWDYIISNVITFLNIPVDIYILYIYGTTRTNTFQVRMLRNRGSFGEVHTDTHTHTK